VHIKGIHVFKGVDEKSYSEHVLMIQALSAIEWKKNGPIHLYTTEKDLKFFNKIGLDSLYDVINTDILDRPDEIYWPHFGAATKMKVLDSIQEFPVAFIDNDLIYRDPIEDSVLNYDITYLHDEGRFWRNYPDLDLLGKRKDYEFPNIPELNTSNPINVGFFIINNKELKEKYCELAMDYMHRNKGLSKNVKWADSDLRKFWKPLFVEQRLLSAVVDNGKFTRHQIFPYTYYGDTCNWENRVSKEKFSNKELFRREKFTWFHLWGEKSIYNKSSKKHLKISMFYKLLNRLFSIDNTKASIIGENIISWVKENNRSKEYNL